MTGSPVLTTHWAARPALPAFRPGVLDIACPRRRAGEGKDSDSESSLQLMIIERRINSRVSTTVINLVSAESRRPAYVVIAEISAMLPVSQFAFRRLVVTAIERSGRAVVRARLGAVVVGMYARVMVTGFAARRV